MTTRRWCAALLVIALGVLVSVSAPRSQTSPIGGVCGFAHVATPPPQLILSGTAYASQSITTATAATVASLIPVMRVGSIVGALLTVDTADIRFRVDGTSPSGTFDGSLIASRTTSQVCGSDLVNFAAISLSGVGTNTTANSILRWQFYTQGG